MKKLMMIFFILLCIFSIKNVYAQDKYTLSLEKQDGIYYARRGGDLPYKSSQYYIYKFGDIIAYCVEPSKQITTWNYVVENGYVDLPYSDELKEKLELIGYYGREYPNHDNVRYSMAAQALIWELTSNQKVTFWTEKNEKGEEINVEREKQEIMDLVNHHNTLPNLPTNISAFVKKKVEIVDTNNVLNSYEVVSDALQKVWIEGNTLHIMPTTPITDSIVLRKSHYDEYETMIFVGENDASQTLGRLRFSKEITKEVTINVEGSKLLIQKTDENNNPVKIENIAFKIKNLKTGEYICEFPDCRYLTDSSGVILTGNLGFGEYEVEEDENQIIPGYTWNNNKLKITINYDSDIKYNDEYHNYMEFNFTNKKVTGNLELYKKGEEYQYTNNDINYQKINLEGVKFLLYDENNTYIDTITTNSNGYAKYEGLKVGKYYVIEENINNNYILDNNKYYFEIKQNNQYDSIINTKLEINNYLKKGTLEFSKEDITTSIGIPNTIIEIYDIKDNLLFTKETDQNGKIIINNLPSGKYYIKEKEANKNYLITDEIIYFEIKENNEIVKAKMTNEKITGSLEIYKTGEEYSILDNEIIYNKNNLSNVEFSLYNENNELIDTLITNESGMIKKDKLPLGNYYLIEKNKDNNYIKDDNKYYFSITQNNRSDNNMIVKVYLQNYLKKGTLEFSKEDITTSIGIPNTIIEIYDIKDNLLFTKETDQNGKIIINNLPSGKYYIKEKEANKNYLITDEIIYFEIKENNEINKVTMVNEKIEVPKTGKNDQLIINLLSSTFILLGVMGIVYEKNKAY